MQHFSDFAEPTHVLDGDKIRIDNILNKEIIVLGFRIHNSKFDKNKSGKCLTLQIKLDDETRVIFTGSDVLISQIEKHKKQIPFLTTIKKVDRFYMFT
ncbi:hypothetical protein [Prosthecochloris sp.]|uniref:hypothetical protein n=1 Tax=Prosthecochloris sp. TaxID=290513 RepID=UPI0025CED1D2|nr:hypothetical protein [Prosthecochloris sp.]